MEVAIKPHTCKAPIEEYIMNHIDRKGVLSYFLQCWGGDYIAKNHKKGKEEQHIPYTLYQIIPMSNKL